MLPAIASCHFRVARVLWTGAFLVAALAPTALPAADDYQLGPDSMVQEGVPQGTVIKRSWRSEKIYPGTVRDYWVFVPKQYDGSAPASVMVFQDGGTYVDPKG